jgi:hypothetical protein
VAFSSRKNHLSLHSKNLRVLETALGWGRHNSHRFYLSLPHPNHHVQNSGPRDFLDEAQTGVSTRSEVHPKDPFHKNTKSPASRTNQGHLHAKRIFK